MSDLMFHDAGKVRDVRKPPTVCDGPRTRKGKWVVTWEAGTRTVRIKIKDASGIVTWLNNPTLAEDIGKMILREIGIEECASDTGAGGVP